MPLIWLNTTAEALFLTSQVPCQLGTYTHLLSFLPIDAHLGSLTTLEGMALVFAPPTSTDCRSLSPLSRPSCTWLASETVSLHPDQCGCFALLCSYGSCFPFTRHDLIQRPGPRNINRVCALVSGKGSETVSKQMR